MAWRGWMEVRREVGYKVLIGNSPEKISWRGCCASLEMQPMHVSQKYPRQLGWDNCSLTGQQLSHFWWMFASALSRSSSLLNHHVTVPTRSAEKALWKYFHFHSQLYYAWLSNVQLWFGHEHGSLSWHTARLCGKSIILKAFNSVYGIENFVLKRKL